MARITIADRERLYNEYKAKYLWKSVDFDWVYWAQCVDLARHYAKNVYNAPIWVFGGSAYSWYLNHSKTFNNQWKRVPYTPWFVPTIWDIWFFKPIPSNTYWHVFICGVGCTPEKLIRLEQNYVSSKSKNFWTWAGAAAITERIWDYKNFVWVWRFMWK